MLLDFLSNIPYNVITLGHYKRHVEDQDGTMFLDQGVY